MGRRGAAALESARILRILQLDKLSLLTVISLALGLPRGLHCSFPCAFRLELQ